MEYRHEILLSIKTHPWEIATATMLGCLFIIIQAFNFLQLLEVDSSPPLSATLHTWALANLTNYIGPLQPGLLVRFGFFKGYGVSIKRVASTTLIQLYLSVWTGLAIAAFAMYFHPDEFIRQSWVIFFLLIILFPLLFRLCLHLFQKINTDSDPLAAFDRTRPLSFLTLPKLIKFWPFPFQYTLMALNIYIVYHGFKAEISLQDAFLFAFFATLSSLFAILPNNLGLQEIFFIATAKLVGVSSFDSIAIAFIYRLAHILACGILLLTTMHSYRKSDRTLTEDNHKGQI